MGSLAHPGRAVPDRTEWAAPADPEVLTGALLPSGRTATAADVMTRLPLTVHSSTSMWTAWDLLRATGGRHLVVVDDDRRPLGVLDERLLALEWPPGPMAARRTPVHTLLRGLPRPRVRRTDDLAGVARLMVDTPADAVPVVHRDGRLAGLVTLWQFAERAAGRLAGEG